MAKLIIKQSELAGERAKRVMETFKLDPAIKITLRGVEYTLEYNNYAVKGVLADVGLNLLSDGFGNLDQIQNPDILGSLLFRGLEINHPELKQADADRLFTTRHYSYVLNRLRAALALFMPDMSDIEVEDVPSIINAEADPI